MSVERRYVFDSNTVVSALLFEQSVPGQAFSRARAEGEIIISEATFSELRDVLAREKFDRYVTLEEREQLLVVMLREATLIEIVCAMHACRDPQDDKFLELAVSGSASCIVSGDHDLLALHPFRGIPILTPAQFLEMLGATA